MHVFIIFNKGRSQRNKMRMRGIDLSELFSGFHPGEIWSVEKGWLYIISNALQLEQQFLGCCLITKVMAAKMLEEGLKIYISLKRTPFVTEMPLSGVYFPNICGQ